MKPVKKTKRKYKHVCVACKESFQFNCLLKYHIRRHHFNRVGFVPYSETQNINQVWFEKVAKTNILVEIKKISNNVLLIQKLKEDTTILPTDMKREVIDLRKQYPISSGGIKETRTVDCKVCGKSYGQRLLGKHFAAVHPNLIRKRCETCGCNFKRVFNCARHVCPKTGIK